MAESDRRWNHNIHYHSIILDAVPDGCRTALDVGCGEGTLTRSLAQRVPDVTGIDLHAESLSLAREQTSAAGLTGVRYFEGDVMTSFGAKSSEAQPTGAQPTEAQPTGAQPTEASTPAAQPLATQSLATQSLATQSLATQSFDLVTSVAVLHHLDARAGLGRMAELVSPGGVLAVVGLARRTLPADLPYELAGAVATRAHSLRKGYWDHPSPIVWPPPETYRSMRLLAAELLPGCRFKHHVMWRYSIVWTKPGR